MSDADIKHLGGDLKGKKIALLVSNSIACEVAPKLARHYRSYGAEITAYSTPNSSWCSYDLRWSTGREVITELTPENTEHLHDFDAYVLAPASYNTIGKFANGIADNAVTTTLASALGRLENGHSKILIAPAMHSTMMNSIYKDNLERLISKGVKVINPRIECNKAKIADYDSIVVETIRELSLSPLKDKKILITGGTIGGKVDDVRKIDNVFRGGTGLLIAKEAYLRGANVYFILGKYGRITPPSYLETKIVPYFNEYRDEVLNEVDKGYDIGIFSAAVADYVPRDVYEGKISSSAGLDSIPLIETEKVIKLVREKSKQIYMVTFKVESGISKQALYEIASKRVNKDGYDIVVANRTQDITSNEHHSIIVDKTGLIADTRTKKETAVKLMDILEAGVKRCIEIKE